MDAVLTEVMRMQMWRQLSMAVLVVGVTGAGAPAYANPTPPPPGTGPATYPEQAVTSLLPMTPGQLLIGGAIVVTVFGAALLSHGIRRLSG